MKVTAQWFGGSNYAAPFPDDVEHFDTIKAARDAFWSRADFDPYYPCVDVEQTEMHLYAGTLQSIEEASGCPDWILTIGPRGGVRRERV